MLNNFSSFDNQNILARHGQNIKKLHKKVLQLRHNIPDIIFRLRSAPANKWIRDPHGLSYSEWQCSSDAFHTWKIPETITFADVATERLKL